MQKVQQKTVEFSHLSEDHKAEFIHFLIKNNICFQEGKENCTAKIAVKSGSKEQKVGGNKENNFIKRNISNLHGKVVKKEVKGSKNGVVRSTRPLKEIAVHNQVSKERGRDEGELKTPKKNNSTLRASSLSCKAASQTLQKNKKTTPKSGRPVQVRNTHNQRVSEYESKTQSFSKNFAQESIRHQTKRIQQNTHEKEGQCVSKRKSQTKKERDRPVNKYHHLFQGVEKGRAVRWPLNMLERAVEQIYDQIFIKNTQCLQTRNIDNALKALNLSTFPQLIDHYFFKKFKSNKLASTNLNNFLFSLSYHVGKESPPIFLTTFEDFLMDRLQHEDTLYYLYARNVLKKELKAVQKARQGRHEGSYFPDGIKSRQIPRLLKSIIGRDSQLLNEYKQIILSQVNGDQIEAYQFLRILLDDFHSRRIINSELDYNQSTSNPLIDTENSYEQRNEELTFGEEHYENDGSVQYTSFWQCMHYSHARDDLMDIILEKLSRKAIQFIQILAADISKPVGQLQKLQKLLLKKAESMVRAVFQMNKMKWLKELNISNPNEQDIATVQNLQIRLKRLRSNPSGKEIGQFCKNILTAEQLVDELESALTSNE